MTNNFEVHKNKNETSFKKQKLKETENKQHSDSLKKQK